MLRRAGGVLWVVAVLALSACSSSGPARPAVCRLAGQQAIARHLGVSSGALSYVSSEGNNGQPQCQFSGRARGRRVTVVVNVDSAPQAYFRLLRTVAEATQIFGPPPPGFRPPQGVSGLGPYASWFPNNRQLMATNYVDLVTVTVTWPGASRDTEVALARSAIRPYLPNEHGRGNHSDYP